MQLAAVTKTPLAKDSSTASPVHDPPAKIASAKTDGPKARMAFYRLDSAPPKIPPVELSKGEEALCKVKVGDTLPAITLPQLGGGGEMKLTELYGKKATVVVFWKSDRRMAREQLTDLGPDVVQPFGERGVGVVGIAVNESADKAQKTVQETDAKFPSLLDADGKAFAQVGSGKLPRTYLLDSSGKILWFDIEYSLTTRRELHQALRVVTGEKVSK
jgi:peroxiredoxin